MSLGLILIVLVIIYLIGGLSGRFGGIPYWDEALPKADGASPR